MGRADLIFCSNCGTRLIEGRYAVYSVKFSKTNLPQLDCDPEESNKKISDNPSGSDRHSQLPEQVLCACGLERCRERPESIEMGGKAEEGCSFGFGCYNADHRYCSHASRSGNLHTRRNIKPFSTGYGSA